MSISDYQRLSLKERTDLLWKEGEYLTSVPGFALYKLFDFFVEVLVSAEEIQDVVAFESGERLEKYKLS